MWVVKNRIIPFQGYKSITIWPFIFTRSELKDVDLNHERIHGRQQAEMLVLPFFIWYGIEYLIRMILGKNVYKNISFEREAYENDENMEYLKHRKLWKWLSYIKG